ncbi:MULTISPECIES: glycosyltransferase family 2 protein [unclassified Sulfuricurvum]|uniref:glycosyltransferase family 2 protein n=1 Tax=unclassified Sulfuricurvum TaxID=2632390 RepID=UPI000AC30D85|nr:MULTISPECIES: glycosyltransferase family 2 protein [unclassified Sulfuricurvum]
MDISFITVNYNSSSHTIELVESIRKYVCKDTAYEIIIVDNASESDDFERLRDTLNEAPALTLIRNRINNGFAGGNMLGVNHARGNYYFFINNDCLLLNDAATEMKNFMDTHEDIGALTAKITDEKGNFSSSYKQFPSVIKQWFGNTIHRKLSAHSFPGNKARLSVPTPVEVISGSCMFFRADVFCDIGGFDTMFFLYCEEEDICKRVWNSGRKIYFLPSAEIFHEGGGSSKNNPALEKEFYISYKLLIDKHFHGFARILIKTALFFKLLRRVATKKRGWEIFVFFLRGTPIKESLRYKQTIQVNRP